MTPTKTLQETVELMLSNDAVDQFKAEYYQLEYRFIQLSEDLLEYDLNPENADNRMNGERNILSDKLGCMRNYLLAMQREARSKNIEL